MRGIDTGRSREGAWIEILANKLAADSYNGRSREGAWIEIRIYCNSFYSRWSLPRGSVD